MSKFSAFMATNVIQVPNKKVVVSTRFRENGKPVEWEVRAISAEENDELQRRFIVNVPVAGRKGQFTRELDNFKYSTAVLAASVVYPNLNDAELQDSYGVKTPEALLKKMLLPREETILAEAVASVTEADNFEELVEDAKN